MDYNIAIIVPNKKISETAKGVLAELDLHYPVYFGYMETTDVITQELQQHGTKIILSVGFTAEYIKKTTNFLVLEMQYTGLEFMTAVKEGLTYSKKVAAIGSKNMFDLMEKTATYFDVPVKIVQLNKNEPVETQAKRVIDQGYDVIISGSPSVDLAEKCGKIGIRIDIDPNMIKAYLVNAHHILKFINDYELEFETIQAILNCTTEGIVGTDENNLVSFINPAFEKMTGIPRQNIYNQPLAKVLKDNKATDILNHKECESNIGERYVIMNSVPVMVGGKTTGSVSIVTEIAAIQRLEQKIRKEILVKGHFAKKIFDDIIGSSKIMTRTKHIAANYAKFDSTILIIGETGTGKEVFAQSIHNASDRRYEPFVAINCAALPENLLESELFGYVKGAFTGARQEGKAGLFEMAHNGTIFLDEVSEIPLNMQARLLRVLEEKEVVRIGDDKVIPINVRILSASNKNLLDLVEQGKFREDLYFRLCVLELHLPPLRQRKEDIRELAGNIIHRHNKRLNRCITGMSEEFAKALEAMEWKGNVRQLRNFLERAIVLSHDNILSADILEEISYNPPNQKLANRGALETMEQVMIENALKETKGNKKEAAQLLGINPTTLWRKLKEKKNDTGIEKDD